MLAQLRQRRDAALGLFLHWRNKLIDKRWYLKLLAFSIPLPLAACQFGWVAAEVGRQPWIVYGLLKTKDAASVVVSSGEILFSLVLFTLIYMALGALWIFLLARKVKAGVEGEVA